VTPDEEGDNDLVLDNDTVTVVVGVNGKEVGIGDFETVIVLDTVGKLDG